MTSRDKNFLASVRQKLQEENQRELVKPFQNLEADTGQQLGGAGSGWGFAAAVPPAVVGGILRYFGAAKAG